jgi:6-phosphogluconate dehydrogenase
LHTIEHKATLGLIGLGVMGKSLARNFAGKGIKLSLYNRHVAHHEVDIAASFVKEHDVLQQSIGFDDMARFMASLALPRKIFLMVNAGPATDAVIQEMLPHLSEGDIIMDGGNSHYKATQGRFDMLVLRGIHFLGVGVSGGEKGALEGPSIMPGGSRKAYKVVGDYLEAIAARDKAGNACCTLVGEGGSGHFTKMMHNGIEYAEMQLIAEVYDVLKTNLGLKNEAIASHFTTWNTGALESYLLEISGKIMRHKEGDTYLIDVILDKAKQKGTGGWSTTAALEIGASLDTISQSVMARIVSGYKKERIVGEKLYSLSRNGASENHEQRENEAVKCNKPLSIETIKKAYNTARIINHCIGIEALRKASSEYNWELNLAEITRIWTNGCIIRSAFMEGLAPILQNSEESLFLDKRLSREIKEGLDALLFFTTTATQSYIAVPVFSAALQYILSYTRADSSANMIQAQRDYFGAHTYERKDKPGNFHTMWEE